MAPTAFSPGSTPTSEEKRPPSDVSIVVELPSKEGRRAAANDEEWTKHLPTIRRLYVDEGKTLKQVMVFMETEHDFKASYDDSETNATYGMHILQAY